MTDPLRSAPAPAASRLELSAARSRPQPAHRDLGRAILDGPLVRGAIWLRWSGHEGIRTLHHGAGLARGWVERDVDGLVGWAALVDGRVVVTCDSDGRTRPVLHLEAWEAGVTLHAVLAQYPARPDDDQSPDEDESDGQEHGLLGETRTRIRRQAAGLTAAAIDQAVAGAHTDLRTADRHADAGDESALARAALAYQEWQRIRSEAATAVGETYDPDRDLGLQTAQTAARHRQDVAQCTAEAAHDARQRTDAVHRQLAGAVADPLYTALARAGLYFLSEADHQAVRDLTRHLDAAALRQVIDWLERTRTAALALRGEQGPSVRPTVRRI